MGKIVVKKIQKTIVGAKLYNYGRQSTMRSVYNEPVVEEQTVVKEDAKSTKKTEEKNNEIKTDTVMMTTNEKIELANAVLTDKPQVKAKRLKNDRGLIERKENTIILTEDNRELLKD